MRKRFRKFVVYLLAVMIVMPSLSMSGLFKAEEASAWSDTIIVDNADSSGYDADGWSTHTHFTGYNGKYNFETDSTTTKTAKWTPSDKKPSMKAGNYKVYAHWSARPVRPSSVEYSITDSNGDVDKQYIDQRKKADQINFVVSPGEASGWALLGNYYFNISTPGSVTLTEVAVGDTSADAIKFEHTNVTPDKPTILSPANGSYSNDVDSILNWTAIVDEDDGTAVTYDVQVKDSSDVVVVDETVASPVYDDTTNGYMAADDTYLWRVRTSDGASYSTWSPVGWSTFIKDTDAPTFGSIAPLSSSVLGGEVSLSWTGATDTNSFTYNIYRSASPMALITSGLTTTTYVDMPGNGTFLYYVSAVDGAGNESDILPASGLSVVVSTPASPVISVVKSADKQITVNFDGVGGGVVEYIIHIDGISRTINASGEVAGTTYSEIFNVLSYGNYLVYVEAVGNGGTSVSSTQSITLSGPAPAPVVKKASVSTSVAPETASAVESTPAPITVEETTDEEAIDEDGVIKGDEGNDEEEEINWTPWIILFILIILAGAATGGYFYWFGDDEKVQTSVKENSKKSSPAPKAKTSAKKKPRRW